MRSLCTIKRQLNGEKNGSLNCDMHNKPECNQSPIFHCRKAKFRNGNHIDFWQFEIDTKITFVEWQHFRGHIICITESEKNEINKKRDA